jgi:hypothetical protein
VAEAAGDPKGTTMTTASESAPATRAESSGAQTAGTDGEAGFSTAELLGNAALGVAALVAIWALLSTVGTGVMTFISNALGI